MSTVKANKYPISPFQKWLITGNPQKKVVITCLLTLVVGTVVGLVIALTSHPHHMNVHHHAVGYEIVVISIPFLIIALVMGWILYKKPFEKMVTDRELYLGVDLNDQDKIALYKWQKYGVVPHSKKLQPILTDYLDYTEQIVTGERQPLGGWIRTARLLFSVGIVLQVVGFIIDVTRHRGIFVHELIKVLFYILLAAFYLAITSRGPRLRTFRRTLASMQLKKLTRMRAQL